MEKLPTPHYQRKESDPAWLAYAAQFHGHLGPWATAGTRAGMAGLRAIGAEGYFDLEITCEGPFVKPPRACFLDGLQVATGCTLGKRNLHWVDAEEVLLRVRNTRTGREAEVRPAKELMRLLTPFKPRPKAEDTAERGGHRDHEHGEDPLEKIARRIAALPQSEILSVNVVEQ